MFNVSLKIPKLPIIKQIPDIYDNIVALGDIHGCIDQLISIYKYLPKGHNATIILGDLVDRGPASGEVVRFLSQDPHTYIVMGNHDDRHIRYEEHRLKGTKKQMPVKEDFLKTHEELTLNDISFLASSPQGYVWRNTLFVHAGIVPNWGVLQPTKSFIRTRYLELKSSIWQMSGTWQDENKVWQHVPEAKRWSEVYNGNIKGLDPESPWKIVYGHANLDDILIENNTYGIDTGCVFGKMLTAAVINCKTEEITFKQVRGYNARRYVDE